MKAQQASKWLLISGAGGVLASVIWWQNFYTKVDQFLGHKGPPPLECLYQLTGPCRMISNVARFFGSDAYDPRLLWLSGFALVASIVFEVVASKTKP